MKVLTTASDPLKQVPFNTQRQFVMAKTLDGCQIYMPVHIHKPETKNVKLLLTHVKDDLQRWLDNQYKKPIPFNFDDPFTEPPKDLA
jgi:hypothetical protein